MHLYQHLGGPQLILISEPNVSLPREDSSATNSIDVAISYCGVFIWFGGNMYYYSCLKRHQIMFCEFNATNCDHNDCSIF